MPPLEEETLGPPASGPEPSAGESPVLLVSGDDGIAVHALHGTRITLGRAPDADIVINDPSVSRTHARLTIGDAIVLEALPSKNGTSIFGRTLGPGERVALSLGTAFGLGFATCVLQRGRRVPFAEGTTSYRPPPARATSAPPGALKEDEPVLVDARMRHLYGMLRLIAPSDLNVIVLGETGVGKDLYARAVHRGSGRAERPFLQLNCAALPEQLLEAELFGYVKGAFTGASDSKPGLFEAADGGTVFLDEIGELSLSTQAKLLRTLESGEVRRVGATQNRRVDVRFVAATNRDLRRRCAEGAFRLDLFFRLNGMTITLPPLRERTSEIGALVRTFVARAAERAGVAPVDVTAAVITRLEAHDWPGNVRELRNIVERAFVLCEGRPLDTRHLELAEPETFGAGARIAAVEQWPAPATQPRADAPLPSAPPSGANLRSELGQIEHARIRDALASAAGNQSEAARQLGMSRHTLMKRLDLYGIPRPRSGR